VEEETCSTAQTAQYELRPQSEQPGHKRDPTASGILWQFNRDCKEKSCENERPELLNFPRAAYLKYATSEALVVSNNRNLPRGNVQFSDARLRVRQQVRQTI